MAEQQVRWWVRDRSIRDRSAAPPPEVEAAPNLDALTKAELVELADAKGLDTSGTKADIIERLSDG